MKLAAVQVAGFLRDPGACRVVLLYGDDAGMIRDRAETLVRAVAGSLDDPFLVAELSRDEMGTLPDEAASLPLTGGRRVVRVRDATDAATDAVRTILKGRAPALVVLGGCDMLRDEGRAYAGRLRDEGVPVDEVCYPGQPHGFINFGFPAAGPAFEHVGHWLRAAFGPVQPA